MLWKGSVVRPPWEVNSSYNSSFDRNIAAISLFWETIQIHNKIFISDHSHYYPVEPKPQILAIWPQIEQSRGHELVSLHLPAVQKSNNLHNIHSLVWPRETSTIHVQQFQIVHPAGRHSFHLVQFSLSWSPQTRGERLPLPPIRELFKLLLNIDSFKLFCDSLIFSSIGIVYFA